MKLLSPTVHARMFYLGAGICIFLTWLLSHDAGTLSEEKRNAP